jgi:hypothetical protein
MVRQFVLSGESTIPNSVAVDCWAVKFRWCAMYEDVTFAITTSLKGTGTAWRSTDEGGIGRKVGQLVGIELRAWTRQLIGHWHVGPQYTLPFC